MPKRKRASTGGSSSGKRGRPAVSTRGGRGRAPAPAVKPKRKAAKDSESEEEASEEEEELSDVATEHSEVCIKYETELSAFFITFKHNALTILCNFKPYLYI